MGYRHVFILPYNAPANGPAEQTVARTSSLLSRHCYKFANWHKALPQIVHSLNTTVHRSTEMTPFFALFGRHPISIPEVEDPELLQATYSGDDFVRSLAFRQQTAWASVREASKNLKEAAIRRAEKYRSQWATASADGTMLGGIRVGDWVWVRHGSKEHARHRRKQGYQAYRPFRVLELLPDSHALRLDVSGHRIQDVVSLRQCKRAPESWWVYDDGSPAAGDFRTPATTTATARGDPREIGGSLTASSHDSDDRDTYSVEWILDAEKFYNRWYYRVQWLGYLEPTWTSGATLRDAGSTVQDWMRLARDRWHERKRRGDYEVDPAVAFGRVHAQAHQPRPVESDEPTAATLEPPLMLPNDVPPPPVMSTQTPYPAVVQSQPDGSLRTVRRSPRFLATVVAPTPNSFAAAWNAARLLFQSSATHL